MDIQIPEDITFEAAISTTQMLLEQLKTQQLEGSLEDIVAKLISTRNGARGFFVAYLTDASPLADEPDPQIIEALKSNPEAIAEILVKNLVMSTAMVITHSRKGDFDQAEQSQQVSHRSATLICQVDSDCFKAEAQSLWQGLKTGSGPYGDFLQKWGYDDEQKFTMAQRLQEVIPEATQI